MRSLLLTLASVLVAGCAAGEESLGDEGAAFGESGDYARWAEVASAHGLQPNRNGEATVIGVRGQTLAGVSHPTRSTRAFDDFVVVLKADHTVMKLAMSTHPFETRGVPGVPDVDGDGAGDVGMIAPGRYRAIGRGPSRLVGGRPAYAVGTAAGSGKLPGTRDTNHDGIFSDAEAEASEARGDVVTAVLFHHANGGAPPAVGCQVFADADITALVTAVGGAKASFDYVLVDDI